MLKTTVLPKVTVSSDEVTRQRTEITLMSYDKNVHQIKIPTDLTASEVNRVLVIFTFPFDESVIQLNGAWVDGHIQFTLPEVLRTQRGDFYIEVNIDLIDSQITFARYRAKVVKSDIDANADHVATFYFELFEDFVTEIADDAKQAKDAIDLQTTGVESHANTSKQSMDSGVNSVHDYGVSAKTTIDAKVNQVEQAKTDALTAIDSDVASVDTYAIDAKSNVDGLVSNATSAIDTKVANVELTKNQALSDIADKQQDVTDTTSQFKSDLSDTQTTIDNQVILANDALNQLDVSLTGLNNKMSLADTTADNVIADATAKGQQVTDAYNTFDNVIASKTASVNQTHDDFIGSVGSLKTLLQYMYNPNYSKVYDRCYRPVTVQTPAQNLTLDSGQNWEMLKYDTDNPVVYYNNNGTLTFNGGATADVTKQSGWLVSGFQTVFPFFNITIRPLSPYHWMRRYYIKFLDKDNWVAINRTNDGIGLLVLVCIAGTVTQVATLASNAANAYPAGIDKESVIDLSCSVIKTHALLSPSSAMLVVFFMGSEVIRYNFTAEQWAVLGVPTKVGFGSRSATEILKFEAGVTI